MSPQTLDIFMWPNHFFHDFWTNLFTLAINNFYLWYLYYIFPNKIFYWEICKEIMDFYFGSRLVTWLCWNIMYTSSSTTTISITTTTTTSTQPQPQPLNSPPPWVSQQGRDLICTMSQVPGMFINLKVYIGVWRSEGQKKGQNGLGLEMHPRYVFFFFY